MQANGPLLEGRGPENPSAESGGGKEDETMVSRLVLVGAMAMGGWAAVAQAEVGGQSAYTVQKPEPNVARVNLIQPRRDRVYVVATQVVERAASVREDLAEQQVHPYRVHLVVVNTPITIDADRNLLNERRTGSIDEGHYLVQAQRAHRAARAAVNERVQTYRSTARQVEAREQPLPRAILMKPDFLREKQDGSPQMTPSVPAAPEKADGEKVVRADF